MTSKMIVEDGVHYEEHTFHVHRYDAEVPFSLRAHSDTLGRFESPGVAAVALEERRHPENLHVETRVEWFEIECTCGGASEDDKRITDIEHYDDCAITIAYQAHGTD